MLTGAEANRLAKVDTLGVLRWQEDQSEVALFGVNYYPPFWHNYPDLKAVGANHKQVIDQDVAHFARLGLDAIRLHVFDREVSNSEGDLLDNEHLELLDYLILRAKERGIYTVLTPIAWWPVPGDSPGFSTRFTMEQMTTDRTSWKPQTRYLAQFVCHTNRFTGLSYRDDPAVVAFELINEPQYPPNTSNAQVTEYINVLADAVRSTGSQKPLFYNGWQGRLSCVRDARVEGSTFGWYPSGLVAGRSLTRDFLPQVAEYGGNNPWNPSMRDASITHKAKIVYEFDAADIPGSYIYPAMARSFRSGGAQIATQFQYDPLPLAPFNQGWQTHYLNLVFAPQKAISFLIAGEAFRRLPRHQDYGRPPQSDRFGPFRVSYREDLSEMVTDDAFFYSNDTQTQPAKPEKLERVVGCGSSAVVRYEGTGAYFLERVKPGAWRLEVYPDAVWVNDPYGEHRLDREVSRLIERQWPMEIHLPDLGKAFRIEPLNTGNTFQASSRAGRFPVRPGVYLLRRSQVPKDGWKDAKLRSSIGMREFHVPLTKVTPTAVRHEPRTSWVEGMPLRVEFTVASTQETASPELTVCGSNVLPQTLPLRRDRAYRYSGLLPGAWLKPGELTYSLRFGAGSNAPSGSANWRWSLVVHSNSAPVSLFEASRHKVRAQGDMPNTQSSVPGMGEGHLALRIAVEKFGPPPSSISLRTDVSEELDPWRERLASRTELCLRARALEDTTTALEVVVLERDGTPWGTNVKITKEWQVIRVPLTSLRHWGHWSGSPPGRGGEGDRPQPQEFAGVNICFGAWLYPGHAEQPHSIELESITVE